MRIHRKNLLNRRAKRNYSKRPSSQSIRILLIISAVLLAFAALLLARYAIATLSAKKLQQEMKDTFTQEAAPVAEAEPVAQDTTQIKARVLPSSAELPDIVPNASAATGPAMGAQFLKLYSKNSDLVGWLKANAVPGIDFAVVQRDNFYYLNHDFYGRLQQSGTVFLDQSSDILPRSSNLILHGHNMKNGTMFGKLYKYLDPKIAASNPLFQFSTLYESSIYVPYAISIVSIDSQSPKYVSLVHADFSSDADMMMYADGLQKFSVIQLPVDVLAGDKLLTLITCHGNEEYERLVVALRQLRPDESADLIKQQYSINSLTIRK